MKHRPTDPACILYRPPRTRWARWRFNRARGSSCPICMPEHRQRFCPVTLGDEGGFTIHQCARPPHGDTAHECGCGHAWWPHPPAAE